MDKAGFFINSCSSCGHNQWVSPKDTMFMCGKCGLIISASFNIQIYVSRPTLNLPNNVEGYEVGRENSLPQVYYDASHDKEINEDFLI